MDRLITELKLPPGDAYYKLRHTIEEVNTAIAAAAGPANANGELEVGAHGLLVVGAHMAARGATMHTKQPRATEVGQTRMAARGATMHTKQPRATEVGQTRMAARGVTMHTKQPRATEVGQTRIAARGETMHKQTRATVVGQTLAT